MKLLSCPVLSCLLSLALLCGASEVNATVVLSNLGLADNGIPQAVTNDPNGGSEYLTYVGSSFVAGSVAGNVWNLDSATLRMDDANSGTTGAFSVAIYANNVDRPGTRLGALTGNTAPTTAGDYVYTASPGSIQLTAGSTYWLVAEAPNTTGNTEAYNWKLASGITYTTQASGWSVDKNRDIALFGTSYATDTGSWFDDNTGLDNTVWRATSGTGGARDWGADEFLQFSISASAATAAPEPSKAAFVLLGLFGLGLRRKRSLSC